MHTLNRPDIKVPAEQIFEECVSGYHGQTKEEQRINKQKRARLMTCKDAVRIDSAQYEEGILQGTFVKTPLPKEVSERDLAAVYSDTFAKENKPGRPYYELIRGTATCGKCPICGSSGGTTELDHYLPKSIFPTLCVTPDNLIPICSTCNKRKRATYSLEKNARPFHLYYDRLPPADNNSKETFQGIYLYAKIEEEYSVSFYVSCPETWSADLCSRVEKHVELYGLLGRYAENVEKGIAEIWCTWHDKVQAELEDNPQAKDDDCLEEIVLQNVVKEYARHWRRTPNTWQSALYRAMDAQKDAIFMWFKKYASDVNRSVEKYFSVG